MENNERDRKLEQWLDEALSEYSAAEPRFGLEQRVVSHIRGAEKARSRWNIWKWMPAFAAIAAVLIVGVAILPITSNKLALSKTRIVHGPTTEKDKALIATQLQQEREEAKPQKNEVAVHNGVPRIVERRRDEERQVGTIVDRDSLGTMNSSAKDSVSSLNGNLVSGAVISSMPQAAPPPPPSTPVPQTVLGGAMNQPSAVGMRSDGLLKVSPVVSADAAAITGPAKETNSGEIPSRSFQTVIALDDTKSAAESAPSGVVSTEKVTVARETPALKRMKKEKQQKERAAQEKAGDAAFAGAFGAVVKTDLKQVPAGPMPFPSPSPLSEQEKLVLAAAKKLKDAPKQDSQGGSMAPVEIKEVQIAPIEAPKK
jgi:hypothetical protein